MQADKAGGTIQRVVKFTRQVSDVVNEKSCASKVQILGVTQVNVAVNQIDHATQQDAARVDEVAAAESRSLNHVKQ